MAETTKLKTSATRRRKKDPKPAASNVAKLVTNVTAIMKAEAQITSNALDIEDTFHNSYTAQVLQPEISPDTYYSLVEQNNALNQCISAMEVNIDGTGFDVVRTDGEEISDSDDKAVELINEFLMEVSPTTSFVTLRRQLRRQLEISGYGCIEVIRNPKDEIIFMRTLESKTIRLMKLADPVSTQRTLIRGGVELKIQTVARERRFIQLVARRKIYFKEFGSNRDLAKATGTFVATGQRLPFEERASEIIYLTVHRSAVSPYGVPRWLNQLPSVIGSRSAEELNLEYFAAGGIPPLMVFISGGAMAQTARKQLEGLLAGKARNKLKGIVADIQSTSGTIDKGGGVRVDVESFGSDRQQDSMFENYDDRCEKRVRASFRLPPLFVGKADDYSYASVFASYTLAEAQVFQPERMEFDEAFNNTVMKEMTKGVYRIKSKPLTVADAETNLNTLRTAMNGGSITKKDLVENLNLVGSVNLKVLDEETGEEIAERFSGSSSADQVRNPHIEDFVDEEQVAASELEPVAKVDLSYLGVLADMQVRNLSKSIPAKELKALETSLKALNAFELDMVNMLVSNKIYASVSNDSVGMTELVGVVSEIKAVHNDPCPAGQVRRNGVCVPKEETEKAEAGDSTGPGGVNNHIHILEAGGVTSESEGHTHTWDAESNTTGSTNKHTHQLG